MSIREGGPRGTVYGASTETQLMAANRVRIGVNSVCHPPHDVVCCGWCDAAAVRAQAKATRRLTGLMQTLKLQDHLKQQVFACFHGHVRACVC
jgi:hypothetical protein